MRLLGRMTPTARASSVLLLATTLLLTGCDEPALAGAPSAPPPEVKIVRAEAQREPDALTFTARLEAVHDVDLRPRVSGPIVRVAFREGDHVAAGAPLFEVDPRPYVARRDRARADSARARAALKLAEQELARARSLRERAVIAAEEVDRRAAETEIRAAESHAAEANLAAAELDVEFATVRAPVDGVVGRALVTEGDHVEAGATSLASLVSVDPMHVLFPVDEATYQRLRSAGEASFRVRVSTDPGGPAMEGVLDTLDNRVDPTTGTAFVRATLPNPDGGLTAGLFARVELFLPPDGPRVLVPETAIAVAQGQRLVLVVDQDDVLAARPVTLGPRVGKRRAITAGLAAGDRVAVGNLTFLRPGARVRPLESPRTSQEAP